VRIELDGLGSPWVEDILAGRRGVMSSLPAWGLSQRM